MTDAEWQGGDCTRTREELDILATTRRIFGNAERGLTVEEIAQLLNMETASVRCCLSSDKWRIALYRRLFEQDEAVKERAIGILESRRLG